VALRAVVMDVGLANRQLLEFQYGEGRTGSFSMSDDVPAPPDRGVQGLDVGDETTICVHGDRILDLREGLSQSCPGAGELTRGKLVAVGKERSRYLRVHYGLDRYAIDLSDSQARALKSHSFAGMQVVDTLSQVTVEPSGWARLEGLLVGGRPIESY
jgi:hypothetical protein